MMFWPSCPQSWQTPLQSSNLEPQMLFLDEPQSQNLPACLFRKDRYNWATTTRFIFKNCPSAHQNPSFQILPALPMRAPEQQNHLILLYCFQRHGPSNTLYHLVRDVKKVRTLSTAGRRPCLDCFLWLESTFVLHELPERSCPRESPHFRTLRVCCLLTMTSLLTTQLRFYLPSLWF